MTICFLNSQSIRNKVDVIEEYIIEKDLDILTIAETWLKKVDELITRLITPNGYTLDHIDRQGKVGGGVAVICKSELSPRMDPLRTFTSFEYMSLVVSPSKSLNIRICVIYRPPVVKDVPVSTFFDQFSELLSSFITEKHKLLILDDFNFHMDICNDDNAEKMNSILSDFGLQQHVTSPTSKSHHILDLVISRECDDLITESPVIDTFISDHAAIISKLNFPKLKKQHTEFSYRNMKSIDIVSVKNDIINSSLLLEPKDNLDDLVDQYNECLSEILDQHAPVITCREKNKESMPWYIDEIKTEKRMMRRHERKWRKSKSNEHYKSFCAQKTKYAKTIRNSKITYYNTLVRTNENDQKVLFKIVKDLSKKTKETPLPAHESKEDLANEFGNYFIEKIDKIRENFSSIEGFDKYDIREFDIPPLDSFKPISTDDVKKLIMKSPTKSCILDPIPTTLLKECVDELLPVTTMIVNMSLSEGMMPSKFKHAVITPLLKKPGADLNFKNYRPVSGLPFLSKVIEKAVSRQLSDPRISIRVQI